MEPLEDFKLWVTSGLLFQESNFGTFAANVVTPLSLAFCCRAEASEKRENPTSLTLAELGDNYNLQTSNYAGIWPQSG